MKLALLTDLHANREALLACLAHAESQRVDRYAFMGDLVGYGGDPAFVVDTVMRYVAQGALAVQGNHDFFAVADLPAKPTLHLEAREALEWTRTQLRPEHAVFLGGLPLTQVEGNMTLVHASAHQPLDWEYVTGIEQAERSMRAARTRMVFSGHVHAPALYRRADDGRMGSHLPLPNSRIPLQPQHQYLVIPGAVGQPRDGNPQACYALYDDVARSLHYFRVDYDHGAAARRVLAVGLPMVFAMRLIEGI
jgi:diadenosine tetraphosphatase ApaH/serine/threonine PP2A family protein phosphatase